ncbi:MAG TPA: hypothetical protein VFL13_06430 [Candidatus Baltobacteraceae bacterium]|nr:hypothetical protein [Candidatus Baltobacteraceae bacterium]
MRCSVRVWRFLGDGYTEYVLARRLDEVLAQTDPFDLAQALERRVRSLSAKQIRGLIRDAQPRLSEYYSQEFSRVSAAPDEASMRSAFAHTLQSNLRAIPLFGPAFGESVLELTPSERAVGFSDEPQQRRSRVVAGTVVAIALAAAAFAGGHYVTEARIQASSATAEPMAIVPLPQVPAARTQVHSKGRNRAMAPHRVAVMPATAAAATPPPATSTPAQPAAAAAPAQQSVPSAARTQSVPVPTPRNRPRPSRTPSPPIAHGEAVVAIPQSKPKHVDTVQSTGIDTSDMPQPYTDATPIPGESPAAISEPHGSRVNTPAPAPHRGGWFHRTIMHIDPFKPHPQPQETP